MSYVVDDVRYAYAVGRVRALETRLLDQPRIDRMVEAEDVERALGVLGETDYREAVVEVKEVLDFDIILSRELKKVLELISSLSHDPELSDLFRLRYDFHNLKVSLKRKYLEQEGGREPKPQTEASGEGGELLDVGLVEAGEIARIVQEEDYEKLPDVLREAVADARSGFEKDRDSQLIDIILDKKMYEVFYERFSRSRSRFLIEFLQIWIDLSNIKIFLRVKDLGKDKEFFEKVYLGYGTLPKELFLKLHDEPLESLVRVLAPTHYGKLVGEAVKDWGVSQSLAGLERMCDDYILEFLKKTKYIVFGLEPLIGYLWAKENELRLIRIIIVGKLNNLPAEAIRERLRKVYI